jgi:hypothetical protein
LPAVIHAPSHTTLKDAISSRLSIGHETGRLPGGYRAADMWRQRAKLVEPRTAAKLLGSSVAVK